jgi:hypothetical protein
MKMKLLKSALKFWQEIIFILVLGVMEYFWIKNISVASQQVGNIVFFCIVILAIICLIGQLYWKNLVLALVLACVFGLSSLYMTFAWLVELIKMTSTEEGYIFGVFSLILSMGLTVTAVTMPIKYLKSINKNEIIINQLKVAPDTN